MRVEDARTFFVAMALRESGQHVYIWGGDDETEGGFDCSGFVSEQLGFCNRAIPDLYTGGRETARGLYAWFDERGVPDLVDVDELRPGCIVFYRRPGRRIHHVSIHVATMGDLSTRTGPKTIGPIAIESGGAGSSATTPREALLRSAGVRLTASDYHGRGVEWVAKDPFSRWGET